MSSSCLASSIMANRRLSTRCSARVCYQQGITPTTATINHIVYADKPCAKAVLLDETQRVVDPKSLNEWVTIEGSKAEKTRYVEVGWPADIPRDRVTLVDTPGSMTSTKRAPRLPTITFRAPTQCCSCSIAHRCSSSRSGRFEQRILRRSRDKLLFVIGKSDLLSPEERAEATRYVRDNLQPLLGAEPMIFPVSARLQLAGRSDESGIPELKSYLQHYLADERGRVLLDNASSDGQRLCAYLRQNLGIKARSLTLSLEELEARIARVQKSCRASSRRCGNYRRGSSLSPMR